MEPSGGSLMPEGLLTGLGDQQIRDLFATFAAPSR